MRQASSGAGGGLTRFQGNPTVRLARAIPPLACSFALLNGIAAGTTLIVDSAQQDPFDYASVNGALAAVNHGDTLRIRFGLGYDEHIIITPPVDTTDVFYLTLEGVPDSTSGALPEISWAANLSSETAPGQEVLYQESVIEIWNQTPAFCRDMQVSISGLHLHGVFAPGTYEYGPGAIAVHNLLADTTQSFATRVDIADNELEADAAFVATVALGGKNRDTLYQQSVVWGDVRYNQIRNHSNDRGDGISSHHFVGHIIGNRITSRSEGMHVGFGFLDAERHSDPPTPPWLAGYHTTLIEHNLIYNCLDEGIHFTQGSQGLVRNNIVVAAPVHDLTPGHRHVWAWPLGNHLLTGIFVGSGHGEPDQLSKRGCQVDTVSVQVGDVVAEVYNNIFDRCRYGVKLGTLAQLTLQNNIISRTVGPKSAGILFIPNANLDPPVFYQGGYNLYYPGTGRNFAPPGFESILHDPDDLIGDDPYFHGWIGESAFSYMLEDTVEVCYPAGIDYSLAIDRGNPDPAFNDNGALNGNASAPAHGSVRNDIGAYGGPAAIWVESVPCTDYSAPD